MGGYLRRWRRPQKGTVHFCLAQLCHGWSLFMDYGWICVVSSRVHRTAPPATVLHRNVGTAISIFLHISAKGATLSIFCLSRHPSSRIGEAASVLDLSIARAGPFPFLSPKNPNQKVRVPIAHDVTDTTRATGRLACSPGKQIATARTAVLRYHGLLANYCSG